MNSLSGVCSNGNSKMQDKYHALKYCVILRPRFYYMNNYVEDKVELTSQHEHCGGYAGSIVTQ